MNDRKETQITMKLREMKKRKWHIGLLVCLSLLVAAGVAGIFHLPAATKTYQVRELTCTAEPPKGEACADFFVHIHNDDCYDGDGHLVCPLPEIKPHRHTEDCYSTGRVLACGLPESDGHQHTADCYTPVRGDLICELSTEPVLDEQGNVLQEGHVHTDECYEWRDELTCGMEEGQGAHHHDDSCYQTETTLTCDKPEIILHTHTDDCYLKDDDGNIYVDENGNAQLICGQVQVLEHVHGPECFTVHELDEEPDETDPESAASGQFFFMDEENEDETEDGTDGTEPDEAGETPETIDETEPVDEETGEPAEETTGEETDKETGEETEQADGKTEESSPEEPLSVRMPAQNFEESTDTVTVRVAAPDGAFPPETTMRVTQIEIESVMGVVQESVGGEITRVQAVDISFFDADGNEIEPMVPIHVDMIPVADSGNDETEEAAAAPDGSVQTILHLDNNGYTTVVEQKDGESTENSTVSFATDSFSVYILVYSNTLEKTVLASDGETYRITLSYDADAGIPADAELAVEEILPDSEEYKTYLQMAENSVENEMVSFARFFDITILSGGQEIQPAAPVDVKIELADTLEEGAKAIHFGEEVEVIDAEVTSLPEKTTDAGTAENAGSEMAFSADGFSVYGVIVTTLEKTITASDGNTYSVSVTYGADAKIPVDAELRVEEIVRPALREEADEEEEGAENDAEPVSLYDEYVAKIESVLENQRIAFARFFDIRIVSADDKVQPAESVDVKIELVENSGKQLTAVHFLETDGETDPAEVQLLVTETSPADNLETAVVFNTDGFSVYGIVELDSAETAASVEELNGNSYFLSLIDGNNHYYYTDPLALVSNAWKFQRTTTLDSANRFYFEESEPDEQGNRFCIYTYDAEGNKKYVNLKIEKNMRYYEFSDDADTATRYSVELHTEGSPTSFVIYHKRAEKEFYYWNRNGNYFELAKSTNASVPKNNNDKIILTKIGSDDSTPSDPYGLDGQSLGILWNVNDVSGSGMMASAGTMNSQITLSDGSGKVTETINVLKNRTATVRVDPVGRTDRVFVAQNSEITMWSFVCCGPAQYYMTAVVNDELKYVRFDDTENQGTGDKGISLVDSPDDRCKITVTEGSGAYNGKYKFSSNGRTLYNNNGNFFTKPETENGANVWMYFAELSNLNDDDFVVYTAKKVSVSGPVNEDGTVDYDVKNGDQVVLYTRIWNEKTLEYEYYAIDYDGMLVRAYMSGDNISWVGSKVNTMLWDFTEYHYLDDDGNETEIPNYYYELQNSYSGKYLAPQVSGTDFLSDSTIGINLNGRRYNEYYSTVLAWDDPYYDYAMLMVPHNEYQLGSAPIALANDTTITSDFYFAIMTDEEETGDHLSIVETIDHTSFGISVKMINYPGGAESTANFHNMIQTNVLGKTSKSGSVVYADLLKKNLSDNGYPDVALSGYTDHNLGELYANSGYAETTVNHTFLASTYSETGYFEYDCTQNFAHLITSTGDIWYGKPMPGGGTYGIGDFVVYDQLGTTSATGDTRRHGQFFPYNDLAETVTVDEAGNLTIVPKYNYSTTMYNTTNIKGQPITSLDPRYGEKLYQIPNNTSKKEAPNVDHYFGMEMEASFMQSESGLDAFGHDLIFEFSGDDDFWLYIDGKLVLDLGGVHSACDGSINFRTGQVIVNGTTTNLRTLYKAAYLEDNPNASLDEINAYLNGFFKDDGSNTGTVFKDFSGHTMKMFYMERGAGASNLHMRFNLAPYVNGEVQLEKEVSGTDNITTRFPFQIWYEDKISGRFVQVGSEGHDLSVRDTVTGDPIPYAALYEPVDGVTYNHVYFLEPGQTLSVQLPSEDTNYYFVECGIDSGTYDQVTANGAVLGGTEVADSDSLKDYQIETDTVSGRKKVIYNNHVSDRAQKSLTVTKRMWRDYDKTTEILSGEGTDADNTVFRFRVYIGAGTDMTVNGVGYAVYNTGKYYVKDPHGYYCIWQDGGFVSTGKTTFSELSTVKPEGEWKSEAEQATFYSSPGGAIDNIKAGYSVEIPGLMAGTPYYIEERSDEIPAGYYLIDYTTTTGAYSSENQGAKGSSGSIAADDTNRTVTVHNQHGYGLVVNKIWSDAAFMESHDDIYFGVYLDDGLVENSVRRLHHPATSVNWFFPELADGKTLKDYLVYELELTAEEGGITVDETTGAVSGYSGITKKDQDSSIDVGGISNEHGYSVSYSYTVGYDRQVLTEEEIANKINSRTDTVTNSRPGIKFMKTDLHGNVLEGARFVLTDGDKITKTFTSDESGLIVVAYLENNKVYTLTETSAPYGYLTLISSVTVEKRIEDGKTVVYVNGSPLDDTNGFYTVTQVGEPTADNMPTVTIKNKAYTLQAVKEDSYSNEAMAGVKFALYKEVNEAGTGNPMPDYYPMSGYENLVTDENGIIPKIAMKNSEKPTGLTAGTYYLREVETPSGYNSLGIYLRIIISETGEISLQSATRPSQSGSWTFGEVSDSLATVAYIEAAGIMQITVKNTPKDPVRIKKMEMLSETKVLAGVGFNLYKISQIGDNHLPRDGEIPIVSGHTDENGLLLLIGLEENTSYYLFETEALPGYNMLTGPVMITTAGKNTVSASLNGTPLTCVKVQDENNNDVWEITVYNSTGYALPSTGGIGTALFTALGGIMAATAGAILTLKRRREPA